MTACSASRTSRILASIALAGSLLGGCGGGGSPSRPTQPVPAITALNVTPSTPTMTAGNTLQLVATATQSDGLTLTTGFEVRWTSSDEKFATVSANGLVTAWREGGATITATSAGITSLVSIRVQSSVRQMNGVVTQTGPTAEPVIEALVTVVDGRYEGVTASTNQLGRFALRDVIGVVKLRVSAPFFDDTEVTVDAGSPIMVRLTPAAGMIIDAIGSSPYARLTSLAELTFGQRRTGPAHLTVAALLPDVRGADTAWCGDLRDDENRVLWQTSYGGNAWYEATRTLTLTGGKSYLLRVYACDSKPRLISYLLRAEHM